MFGPFLSMNYPSWSISSEMISYTLFGFALFAFRKNAKVFLLLLLAGAASFIIYKGEFLFIEDYGFIRGLFCFILGYFVYLLSGKITTATFSTAAEAYLYPFYCCLLNIFRAVTPNTAVYICCRHIYIYPWQRHSKPFFRKRAYPVSW